MHNLVHLNPAGCWFVVSHTYRSMRLGLCGIAILIALGLASLPLRAITATLTSSSLPLLSVPVSALPALSTGIFALPTLPTLPATSATPPAAAQTLRYILGF